MAADVFNVFISSPSDVFSERERIERVINRLNGELGGRTLLRPIRWESSYYTADKTFQDQIIPPSQTDLVICILWKRLGAELPPAYRRQDGTTPTGTEYEFEDAVKAARARGTPDVLVYRKTAAVLLDAERVEVERAQFEALKSFWTRWFQTEAGHFTAAYESFGTTDEFEAKVESHIRQWLARHNADLTGAVTWPIALKGSPFRGLQPFDESHSEVFFGRRRVVEQIREKLSDAAARGTPFLLLLGTSGSGKSSVTRAGVVPRVTQIGAVPGVDLWRRCVVRPSEGGEGALSSIARALYRADVLPELGLGDTPTPADFLELLRTAPEAAARALRMALGRAGKVVAAREGFDRPVEARILLVVDQFEEALANPAEAELFGRALAALIADGQTWVIGTLRSDLYGAFQASPALVALRQRGGSFDLLPPSPVEIAEIVRGPAESAGLQFETKDGVGLDEELVTAAAKPGSLPLLQLALDELFASRDPQTNMLAFAAYDRFGGLVGVVERRAEQTLAGLDPEAREALPRALASLVEVSENGIVASVPVMRDAAGRAPGAGRLIEAFVTARLLIADQREGVATVRVAHEALFASWPRAQRLIAADRDALRIRGRLAEGARRWIAEDRHPDFLLPPGRPLAEALDLLAHRPDLLSADMDAFLDTSREAEATRLSEAKAQAERELRLQREAADTRAESALRLARRTRIAAIAVSLLLLIATGAGVIAWFERGKSQRRAVLAERNFGAALNIAAKSGESARLYGEKNYPGSIRASREALDIVQKIKSRDNEAADYYALQRTEAALHEVIGGAMMLAGDSREANAEFSTSLALFQRAAALAAPEDHAEDDIVEIQQLIAGALFVQGDIPTAVEHLRDAAARAAPVIGQDPGRTSLAARLSDVHKKIGDFLELAGDYSGALAAYQAGQSVAERIGAGRPAEANRLKQAAENEEGKGVALLKLNQAGQALEQFQAAFASIKQATASKPDEADWQHRAVSIEHHIAMALEAKGEMAAALDHETAALARAEALLARDPSNDSWRHDVAMAHVFVGVSLKLNMREAEAKEHFDKFQALSNQVKSK